MPGKRASPLGRARTSPGRQTPSGAPGLGAAPPLLHRVGEDLEHLGRVAPAEAWVGDALAEDELLAGNQLLASLDEVRLDHDADDAARAAGDLRADRARDLDLSLVLLGRVGVRAVDHQPAGKLRLGELLAG